MNSISKLTRQQGECTFWPCSFYDWLTCIIFILSFFSYNNFIHLDLQIEKLFEINFQTIQKKVVSCNNTQSKFWIIMIILINNFAATRIVIIIIITYTKQFQYNPAYKPRYKVIHRVHAGEVFNKYCIVSCN